MRNKKKPEDVSEDLTKRLEELTFQFRYYINNQLIIDLIY